MVSQNAVDGRESAIDNKSSHSEVHELASEWKKAIKVHVISWIICLVAIGQTRGMAASETEMMVVFLMALATILYLVDAFTSALIDF